MFNFSYTLFICPLLLPLMLDVAPLDVGVSVGGGMWVENLYIQETSFKAPPSETVHSYVKLCTFSAWL